MSDDPIRNPDLYDFAIIAGVVTPGICEMTDGARKWKWDVPETKGSDGASPTSKGKDIAHPRMKLTLWRADDVENHFTEWEHGMLPVLKRAHETKPPTALDIYYPTLALNDIRSVCVEEIGDLRHEGGGLWTVEVLFIEFLPPKPAGGKPIGSKHAGGVSSGVDWSEYDPMTGAPLNWVPPKTAEEIAIEQETKEKQDEEARLIKELFS